MVSAAEDAVELGCESGRGGPQGELLVEGDLVRGVPGWWSVMVTPQEAVAVRRGERCADPGGEVVERRVERGAVSGRHRVGHRPVRRRTRPGSSSSWALSQTATTRSLGSSTSASSEVQVWASARPCLRAVRTAPDATRSAGWVPAEAAGTAAGAGPQRGGELRTGGVGGAHEHHPRHFCQRQRAAGRARRRAAAAGRCGGGRPRTGAGPPALPARGRRDGVPAGSTASPASTASSLGEASPTERWSTIGSRAGSASAAWMAVRRSSEDLAERNCSIVIDTMVTERTPRVKLPVAGLLRRRAPQRRPRLLPGRGTRRSSRRAGRRARRRRRAPTAAATRAGAVRMPFRVP